MIAAKYVLSSINLSHKVSELSVMTMIALIVFVVIIVTIYEAVVSGVI